MSCPSNLATIQVVVPCLLQQIPRSGVLRALAPPHPPTHPRAAGFKAACSDGTGRCFRLITKGAVTGWVLNHPGITTPPAAVCTVDPSEPSLPSKGGRRGGGWEVLPEHPGGLLESESRSLMTPLTNSVLPCVHVCAGLGSPAMQALLHYSPWRNSGSSRECGMA